MVCRAAARGCCVASAPVTRPDPAQSPPGRTGAPAPLAVAASLVAVEAALLVGYGVVLLASVHRERLAMGLTTPVFFVLYGAGLGYGAWALVRLRSWARAPLVLAQLIQIGVAWSFRGGAATVVTVVLALLAVLVLGGVFHPASLAALSEDRPAD